MAEHTAPLFSHNAEQPTSDSYYTPPWLLDAIGLTYSIDVAAPPPGRLNHVPAHRYYTQADDGLAQPWTGTVFCNPPFSGAKLWATRMADHHNGVMVVSIPGGKSWFPDLFRPGDTCYFPSNVKFYNDRAERWDNIPWPVAVAGLGAKAAAAVARIESHGYPGVTMTVTQ